MSAPRLTIGNLQKAATQVFHRINNEGSALRHIDVLDELCEGFFGCPYDVAEKTILSQNEEAEVQERPVFVLASIGNNTILARNGVYISATNPGTDMEIPHRVLENQAILNCSQEKGELWHVDLPDPLARIEFESDDEVVDLLQKMGMFSRDQPIFFRLCGIGHAGLDQSCMKVDEMPVFEFQYFDDEQEIMPEHLDSEIVLTLFSRLPDGTCHEQGFTFENLCNAKYVGDQRWEVPVPSHDDKVVLYAH